MRGSRWTQDQVEALAAAWDRGAGIVAAAAITGKSVSATQTKASRLGLPRREDGCRVYWPDESEWAFVLAMYTTTGPSGCRYIDVPGIASELGRSIDAVVERLHEHVTVDAIIVDATDLVAAKSDPSPLRVCSNCGRRYHRSQGRLLCQRCQ